MAVTTLVRDLQDLESMFYPRAQGSKYFRICLLKIHTMLYYCTTLRVCAALRFEYKLKQFTFPDASKAEASPQTLFLPSPLPYHICAICVYIRKGLGMRLSLRRYYHALPHLLAAAVLPNLQGQLSEAISSSAIHSAKRELQWALQIARFLLWQKSIQLCMCSLVQYTALHISLSAMASSA